MSTDQTDSIWKTAQSLLNEAFYTRNSAVRLVGIGISNFGGDVGQKDLFSIVSENNGRPQKGELIDRLSDDIKNRFGNKIISRGKSLGVDGSKGIKK
jgi:hypothetical protein